MAKISPQERALRLCLREWVLYFLDQYLDEHEGADAKEFADYIDISPSHLSNIKNTETTDRLPGLDVAYRLNQKYGRDLHRLFMEPPPREPRRTTTAGPARVSPSAAKPGRRTVEGGRR